jgi:hypothetical protein
LLNIAMLALIKFINKELGLIFKLLYLNYTAEVIKHLQKKAYINKNSLFSFHDNKLLWYKGQFIMLNLQEIKTRLIYKAYN